MKPDGSHECDRCGAGVGNGSVALALVVSDMDPSQEGHIRILHFCRGREEGDTVVKGCVNKVLSARNMQHYEEMKSNGE